jgi:ElaB/YqjD/DUF883 family membrane-anchored ribosome-binding protein
MDNDKNKYETPEQETSGEPGKSGAKAKSAMDRGAEAFEHAEQAVSDAYDKTSEKVGETYDKAKNYSHDNPGKTILIALGIGVGLGLLLGASSGRSRTSRIAQPVVHALTDIASEFFG